MQKGLFYLIIGFGITMLLVSSTSFDVPRSFADERFAKLSACNKLLNYFVLEYTQIVNPLKDQFKTIAKNCLESDALKNAQTLYELRKGCAIFLENVQLFEYNGTLDGLEVSDYFTRTTDLLIQFSNTLRKHQELKQDEKLNNEIHESLNLLTFAGEAEKRARNLFHAFAEQVRDYAENSTPPIDYFSKQRWNAWYKQSNQTDNQGEALKRFFRMCIQY